MAFSLEEFAGKRPYLYHLTARRNLERIRGTWLLQSAEELMRESGDPSLPVDRKRRSLEVRINGATVHLRDQDPLHEGNIAFDGGWTFRSFVRLLNGHVFFWAGKDSGPNDYGVRHFLRYESERPLILRVETEGLIAANREQQPRFCRYNSGSPRCSYGSKSPRGNSTFVTSKAADFSPAKAVEVVLQSRAILPPKIESADHPTGPWKPVLRV